MLTGARLRAFTERTLTSEPDLRRRRAETCEHGYAVSRGEPDRDVLDVAAPVRDDHDVVAAISIAAFPAHGPDDRLPGLLDAVRAAGGEISATPALHG